MNKIETRLSRLSVSDSKLQCNTASLSGVYIGQ